MSSKRRLPVIRTGPSPVTPKTGPADPPVVPNLVCLLCGEQFCGPAALRLRHGCVQHRKWGAEFIELPFDDRTKAKWVCVKCARECGIIDGALQFAPILGDLSVDGHCCLCRRDIEPYPLKEWSSAIRIELGTMEVSSKGPFVIFRPSELGHVHYMCMDELHIELWRLIERTDTPDFRECLP